LQFIIIGATLILIFVAIRLCVVYKDKINFYSKGLDEKFRFSEIHLLWKLAKQTNLEEPLSLFASVPSLNKCISQLISKSKREGSDKSFKMQNFLSKLYKFRTNIALDADQKKGLDDTRSLEKGQKLRIVLKGQGVFLSKIVNNGHEIVITVPKQDNLIKISGDEWVGKQISVYLWRKGDASYVFDSLVFNAGIFQGESCLYIQETDKLIRAQKRQSVRCECKIYASMYIIKSAVVDYNVVENEPGYKCLLEDISEDGALIRIGGKGLKDAQIKLQFTLNDTFIIMYGIIRAVEYNDTIKQSRLHFECIHIEPSMKNAVLSYVYNVIPQEDKEINEAIAQTESDAIDNGESLESVQKANQIVNQEDIALDNKITPEEDVPVDEDEINIPDELK